MKISPELLIYKFDYHVPDVSPNLLLKMLTRTEYVHSLLGKEKSIVQLHFLSKARMVLLGMVYTNTIGEKFEVNDSSE